MRRIGSVGLAACLLAGSPAVGAAPGGSASLPPPKPFFASVAYLHCQISVAGEVSDCEVLGEAPTELGLGALALKAVNGVRTNPVLDAKRKPTAARATLGVCFDTSQATPVMVGMGSACRLPQVTYTMTDIVKRWSDEEIQAVTPKTARAPKGAIARLSCQVNTDGLLRDCAVAAEQPAGMGYGEAAMKLAPLVAVRPTVRENYARPGAMNLYVTFPATK